METLPSKHKAIDKQNTFLVEIPEGYSRAKALSYIQNHEEVRNKVAIKIPSELDRKRLYKVFADIGADNKLPSKGPQITAVLNEFYLTMYLTNDLVPAEIPFDVLITEFNRALVQGKVSIKGHNKRALCTALNEWVTKKATRERLIMVRDESYPNKAPKRIENKPVERSIQDYSYEELQEQIRKSKIHYEQFELESIKIWIEKLQTELNKRGQS